MTIATVRPIVLGGGYILMIAICAGDPIHETMPLPWTDDRVPSPSVFPSTPHAPGIPPATTTPKPAPAAVYPRALPVTTADAAPVNVPGPDVGDSFDNIEFVDASLKGKLRVLRVGSDRTADDLMSVFAGLKNRTAKVLALEVQTIYKDKDGNSLNKSSWIPVTLKPNGQTEYRSVSISVDADDFMVRVRLAVN